MKTATKAFLLFSSILIWLLFMALVKFIFIFSLAWRRKLVSRLVNAFGRTAVRIMGIRVELSGKKELLKQRGLFFVCNHLSYVDGIVATSLTPLVFIGKTDLRRWPFFGFFISLSETIFVDRTTPVYIQKEMEKIVSFLKNDINVILFPEGTSTNGDKLLPFKSSFFAAPLSARRPVVPLVLRYKTVNNEPISEKNRDLVCWYGSMPFLPHLFGVLKLKSIVMEVKVCDSIECLEQGLINATSQRKQLCQLSRQAIESCLNT